MKGITKNQLNLLLLAGGAYLLWRFRFAFNLAGKGIDAAQEAVEKTQEAITEQAIDSTSVYGVPIEALEANNSLPTADALGNFIGDANTLTESQEAFYKAAGKFMPRIKRGEGPLANYDPEAENKFSFFKFLGI